MSLEVGRSVKLSTADVTAIRLLSCRGKDKNEGQNPAATGAETCEGGGGVLSVPVCTVL